MSSGVSCVKMPSLYASQNNITKRYITTFCRKQV